MKQFNVLTLGKYLSDEEFNIVYKAFANLSNDVTPKHRKKMKLFIIDRVEKNSYLYQKSKENKIDDLLEIVNGDHEDCEEIFENASILLLPGEDAPIKVISKSFSYSIPILGYHHLKEQDLVDQTCGMLVRHRNERDTVLEFSHLLNILYFDMEVRKILERGALEKYHASFTWGGTAKVG